PGRDPVQALVREFGAASQELRLGWTLDHVREQLGRKGGIVALADGLLLAAQRRHLLLTVDQFEEVLTQADLESWARFAAVLSEAQRGPIQAVATLRPESLPELLESQADARLPLHEVYTLRPLGRERLKEVIVGPASLAGIGFEDGLVDRMIDDTGTGDALPLLAFALAELARGVMRGGTLSIQRYEELGGVRGALEQQAEAALKKACAVSGRGRSDVLAGLLPLVTVDERGQPARVRVERGQLAEAVRAELDVFVTSRLLTTDRDEESGAVHYEVAHEAFLTGWAPLSQAISATASALRTARAAEWEAGQPRPRLWSGDQLTAALAELRGPGPRRPGWLPFQPPVVYRVELSDRARGFLARSVRRDRGRRLRASAVLALLLVIAACTAGIALVQRQAALTQQQLATADQLTIEADSLRDTQPDTSMMLSEEALRLVPSADARAGLFQTLLKSPHAGTFKGHKGPVLAVAFNPHDQTLVTGGEDGTAILWDLTDPVRLGRLTTMSALDPVSAVAFSPDGHLLAIATGDEVILYDVSLRGHPVLLTTQIRHDDNATILAVAFSPDRRMLATASNDSMTVLWNVVDPASPASLATLHGHTDSVRAVAFSPDDRTLATAGNDRTAMLWDLTNRPQPPPLATLTGHAGPIHGMAFSPDGRTLATAGGDDTAILWDVSDRAQPVRLAGLTGHTDAVQAVAFSPDGHTLVTASDDHRAFLWDVSDPTRAESRTTLTGHTDAVQGVAFSPDGRTLATASRDETARLWYATDRTNPARVATLSGSVGSALAPDGRTLATAAGDGTVSLWDLTDRAQPAHLVTLSGHVDVVLWLAFSPDGRTLATVSRDGTALLWDIRDRRQPVTGAPLRGGTAALVAVAFSPDGRTLATAGLNRTATLWDVGSHTRLAVLSAHADAVWAVAFSPDGRTLVTAGGDHTAILWDVTDRKSPTRRATLTGHSAVVWAAVFSPDGHTLATAGGDHTAILWDLTGAAAPVRLATIVGHTESVLAATFSPDGHILATAGADHTAILWDLTDRASPTRLATVTGHTDSIQSVRFTRDGRSLVTSSTNQTTVLWDVADATYTASHADALACAIAGPSLSPEDWARYVRSLPYERICP
ncbi:MAG TPA: WD40 repeat domain-containing protein, partial [Candidatus Eisenbacteria bacterium]|nr:WD40 repeat domain-containing protein [Candidatus Eisenbacteria bacterium]